MMDGIMGIPMLVCGIIAVLIIALLVVVIMKLLKK